MNNMNRLTKNFMKMSRTKKLMKPFRMRRNNRTNSILSIVGVGAAAVFFSMNRNRDIMSSKTFKSIAQNLQHSSMPIRQAITELGEEIIPTNKSNQQPNIQNTPGE
ncbi:hypothetical protein [Bacillus solimangrovi]|uniref:Uncharacterized protein n=1 Tax=Bacillus solimangrovi TaxID=1305675 RepID=A0A1E5LF26_9BACI|nr:hypothetical protein [Bacillus solimangrovi]OEH92674.1 hypothetical protein BFG57_01320 [Bacillus solimangrovi]